jgi:formiminotetrahydrofolate cyclodeaminase
MAAGLSLKKGTLKENEAEKIRKNALAIQKSLLRGADEDARGYEGVLKAFRLPKNTERERIARTRAIQKAYRNAVVTPRLVSHQALQLMEFSRVLILKGNPSALSDAAVAALLADAAFGGGLLNIGVNLVPLSDRKFVKRMNLMMKQMARERNRLMKRVLDKLVAIKGR